MVETDLDEVMGLAPPPPTASPTSTTTTTSTRPPPLALPSTPFATALPPPSPAAVPAPPTPLPHVLAAAAAAADIPSDGGLTLRLGGDDTPHPPRSPLPPISPAEFAAAFAALLAGTASDAQLSAVQQHIHDVGGDYVDPTGGHILLVDPELVEKELQTAAGPDLTDDARVQQLFAQARRLTHGGFAPMSEFLTGVLVIAGSRLPRAKQLRFLFDALDINASGAISLNELRVFLHLATASCDLHIGRSMIEVLAASLLAEADRGNDSEICFPEFCALFERHPELGEALSTELSSPSAPPHRGGMLSRKGAGGDPAPGSTSRGGSSSSNTSAWERILPDWVSELHHHDPVGLIWLIIYVVLNLGLFALQYTLWVTDDDAEALFGQCIGVARGSAQALSFNAFLVLWPILRPVLTRLRRSPLRTVLPLDSAIEFHKIAACALLFWTVTHTAGHICNVSRLVRSTPDKVTAVYGSTHFDGGVPSLGEAVNTLPIITGICMLFCFAVAFPFTLERVRRTHFRRFWLSHHFFIVFLLLLTFHGAKRLLGAFPQAPFWLALPLLLYLGDRLSRAWRPANQTQIVSAEKKEPDVLALYFRKPPGWRPLAGQYVYLRVPTISRIEWHPFTLTSAPHDHFLSCHIRAVGPWTKKLLEHCENVNQHNTRTLYTINSSSRMLASTGAAGSPAPGSGDGIHRVISVASISSNLSLALAPAHSHTALSRLGSIGSRKAQRLSLPASPALSRDRSLHSLRSAHSLTPVRSHLRLDEFELSHSRHPPSLVGTGAGLGSLKRSGYSGSLQRHEPEFAHHDVSAPIAEDEGEGEAPGERADTLGQSALAVPRPASQPAPSTSTKPTTPTISPDITAAASPDTAAAVSPTPTASHAAVELPTLEAFPEMQVSGPFGAPSQEYYKYEEVMLIGAGIGVTPMAGVLRDILQSVLWQESDGTTSPPLVNQARTVARRNTRMRNFGSRRRLGRSESSASRGAGGAAAAPDELHIDGPIGPKANRVQRVFFHWTSRTNDSFSWFSELIDQLAELDVNDMVELNNHITGVKAGPNTNPLTRALVELARRFALEHKELCVISGLRTRKLTSVGRPNWTEAFARARADIQHRRNLPPHSLGKSHLGSHSAASGLSATLGAELTAGPHRSDQTVVDVTKAIPDEPLEVGVFFCGPTAMGDAISAAAIAASDDIIRFVFRAESF